MEKHSSESVIVDSSTAKKLLIINFDCLNSEMIPIIRDLLEANKLNKTLRIIVITKHSVTYDLVDGNLLSPEGLGIDLITNENLAVNYIVDAFSLYRYDAGISISQKKPAFTRQAPVWQGIDVDYFQFLSNHQHAIQGIKDFRSQDLLEALKVSPRVNQCLKLKVKFKLKK